MKAGLRGVLGRPGRLWELGLTRRSERTPGGDAPAPQGPHIQPEKELGSGGPSQKGNRSTRGTVTRSGGRGACGLGCAGPAVGGAEQHTLGPRPCQPAPQPAPVPELWLFPPLLIWHQWVPQAQPDPPCTPHTSLSVPGAHCYSLRAALCWSGFRGVSGHTEALPRPARTPGSLQPSSMLPELSPPPLGPAG